MSRSDKCVFTGLITFQSTEIINQLQTGLFKSQIFLTDPVKQLRFSLIDDILRAHLAHYLLTLK